MPTPETRRGSRRWTIAGIATVVAAAGAIMATYTPLFAAREIRVRGSAGIPRAEVLSLAGVDDRTNVFHLDAAALERRLERDPRILAARVTPSLPDEVSIDIVPRRPVAMVGAPAALVGADGVLIGPARSGVDLPVLLFPDGGPVGGGGLATAAATAGAFDPALRRAVDTVVVTADGEVEVRLSAGFSATFGEASELEAKAASLAVLLAWVEEQDLAVVSADLTVPGSPTAQMERGPATVPLP